MGWRRGESWFDTDWSWLQEPTVDRAGAASLELNAPAFFDLNPAALVEAIPNGLAESRRRRAELRRRRDTRKTRAAALVIGPAVVMAVAAPRLGGTSRAGEPLAQDPPSQVNTIRKAAAEETRTPEPAFEPIRWHRAASHGLPYAGSLHSGTQLPLEGRDWVTWNPVEDRVPNRPYRLYGNDLLIRKLLAVATSYRDEFRGAPRVLVGDISFRQGGPMEQHRSHQNGLDVDVYYPRRDRTRRPASSPRQIDRRLTQDLVNRFVAAGAEKIFVGYATGLRGPAGIVVPYPNHEDHLHVRFRNPQS